MIPVAELKTAWLNISADDTSVDAVLELIEAAAVEVVERATGKYFGAVSSFTEVRQGRDTRWLDLSDIPTEPPETVVERRFAGADPRTISASAHDGFEVRTWAHPQRPRARLVRKGGLVWQRGHDYTVTYNRGYSAGNEPKDVRLRVADLVVQKWNALELGGSTLRGETVGPVTFTYNDTASLPDRDGESWDDFVRRWQGLVFA